MRLNTAPYEVKWVNEFEAYQITGPGIIEEITRDSRFSAEQLAHCMSLCYLAGKADLRDELMTGD